MTFTCYGQSNAYEFFHKWFQEIKQAELENQLEEWENDGGMIWKEN